MQLKTVKNESSRFSKIFAKCNRHFFLFELPNWKNSLRCTAGLQEWMSEWVSEWVSELCSEALCSEALWSSEALWGSLKFSEALWSFPKLSHYLSESLSDSLSFSPETLLRLSETLQQTLLISNHATTLCTDSAQTLLQMLHILCSDFAQTCHRLSGIRLYTDFLPQTFYHTQTLCHKLYQFHVAYAAKSTFGSQAVTRARYFLPGWLLSRWQ